MSTVFAWRGEMEGRHHMEVKADMMRVDYRFQVRDVASSRLLAAVRRQGIEGERPLNDWTSFVLRVEDDQDFALMALFAITLVEEFRGDV
ncbi:hypothetical protein FGB62_143g01 [Gracilaria domingensis]|nr:hypothetical protein FGB62_143g01 [Gracilaria domingensis]